MLGNNNSAINRMDPSVDSFGCEKWCCNHGNPAQSYLQVPNICFTTPTNLLFLCKRNLYCVHEASLEVPHKPIVLRKWNLLAYLFPKSRGSSSQCILSRLLRYIELARGRRVEAVIS